MPFILVNLSSSLFNNPPDKDDNFKNNKKKYKIRCLKYCFIYLLVYFTTLPKRKTILGIKKWYKIRCLSYCLIYILVYFTTLPKRKTILRIKKMISVKKPFILSNLSSSLFYNPPDKDDNFKN